MAETDRADGNVGVGLRGLVSSIVSNVRVHNTIVVVCAVGAWGGGRSRRASGRAIWQR
jgi:hypothetical protein